LSGKTLAVLDEFIISRRRNFVVEVKRRLEREFFVRDDEMNVGGTSVRTERLRIRSNKDRHMKKSMISTPALLTEDFSIFLSHFLLSSSLLKVLYSSFHTS
jgi:hypothetical protein